jgi:hypothetical protein
MLEVTPPYSSDSCHCEVSNMQGWPVQRERIPLKLQYFYTKLKGACEDHQVTNMYFFYYDGGA